MSELISSELKTQIRSRQQSLVSNSSSLPSELLRLTAEIDALPVYWDMGGVLALTPNGEVIMFSWDDPTGVQTVHDAVIRNLALFQASKRYPELQSLAPSRPPDAHECSYCRGTGYPSALENSGTENVVCHCGGLGWLPNEEGESARLLSEQTEGATFKID
jgi:hypothetical protein